VRSDRFSELAISLFASLRPTQYFLLTARQLDRAAHGTSDLQQLFHLSGNNLQRFLSGLHHNDVVLGRVAENHAMHGQQPDGFLHWKLPVRTGFDVKP
jgi:hypothetical protein